MFEYAATPRYTTCSPDCVLTLWPAMRQFEAEMENFSQSSVALQRVAADIAASGRAIEHLKEQKAGAAPLCTIGGTVEQAGDSGLLGSAI